MTAFGWLSTWRGTLKIWYLLNQHLCCMAIYGQATQSRMWKVRQQSSTQQYITAGVKQSWV